MNRRVIWLSAALVGGLLVFTLGCIVLIPSLVYPALPAADLRGITSAQSRIQLQQAQSELQNTVRADVLQALAGLLLVAGAAATWRQVQVSRDGQITERLTRAVDQIGSDNVDIRIGGIYALERISRNSAADRNAVQFILGAFVRHHAPWPAGTTGGPQHPTATVNEDLPWLRVRHADIQAALEVLARRPPSPQERQLYLSRVDLRSVQLDGAILPRTQMRHANLARAWLRAARLDGSDLKATDLRKAYLPAAHLTDANLSGAFLQQADLTGADLSRANLSGADLRGATLDGTVLAGAHADAKTSWPDGLDTAQRHKLGIVETIPEPSNPQSP